MKSFKVFFPLIILSLTLFSFYHLYRDSLESPVYSKEYYHNLKQNKDFPRVNGPIYDMVLSEDGNTLYLGGDFSQIGDIGGIGVVYERDNLAAINLSDYSITSWAPVVDGLIRVIEVYGDSVYIGGDFNNVNEIYTGEFAKLNSDGSLNTDCMPNIHSSEEPKTVYSIEVTSNYIYVGGGFNKIGTSENEETVSNLVRLNNNINCTWDSSWTPSPNAGVFDIEVDGDSIYIGGGFNSINDTHTGEFAKLNPDGSLNESCTPNIHTFDQGPPSTVYNITLTDEYIYIGGSFDSIANYSKNVYGLIRLENSNNCAWDSSWIPKVYRDQYAAVLTISPVGNDLFVGGSFEYIGGLGYTEFAIIDGDTGDAIQYWNPNILSAPLSTVHSSIFDGEQLYIGGTFYSVRGNTNYRHLASYTYSYDVVPTIEINTIEDLDSIREDLIANYKLTKDLDFNDCSSYADCGNKEKYTTDKGWIPIGSFNFETQTSDLYNGTFDGQGHTISNIYINNMELFSAGLFGFVGTKGIVKNIGIENADITASFMPGGLVGGLMGKVENSYSKGNIVGYICVGGLVGGQGLDILLELLGSENLVPSIISNSYSEATVTAENSYESSAGGLIGCNAGDVINSYSTGVVSGEDTIGGLIGADWGEAHVTNSYWDNETSGQTISDGGIGKTTSQMKSIATYENWDIIGMSNFNPSNPNKWYIDEENDYPRLFWEYQAPEINTKPATDITWNKATLNGELVEIADESSVQVYYEYKKSGDVWSVSPHSTKTTTSTHSYELTDLEKETKYEYRAVVSWRDVGKVYGETLSFMTLPLPTIPTTFGPISSNIDLIKNISNTERDLVLTRADIGSITFSPGLDLLENINELLQLEEYLIVEYVPIKNIFRARIHSTGLSYLATKPAVIQYLNISQKLGITGLTEDNFKNRLYISVYNDSDTLVSNTDSYFSWDNVTYDPVTDTLILPVNHFSEYVLGTNQLAQTGMNILPVLLIALGMFASISVVRIVKKRDDKIVET